MPQKTSASDSPSKWAIAIHGGAGAITRERLTPQQERAYRAALANVIEAGAAVLAQGGPALDAVETAVRLLEDDPLFNAGKGAVFTVEGRNELDAAIMDGATLGAGAVTGVTHTRNPITLARAVMEHSPHVMLVGEPAEAFGETQGLAQVDPSYFFTPRRWRSLISALNAANLPAPQPPPGVALDQAPLAYDEGAQGTVGAVACDTRGNVAAATSTGGMTAKRWGRVGDSPVIGAGTYAANASCAVSASGTGEHFIRLGAARDVCALMELKGMTLQGAIDLVIQNKLPAIGGSGGMIAAGPDGRIAWSFNTSGMHRARMAEGEPLIVGIFKDDP